MTQHPWIAPGRSQVATFLVVENAEAVVDFAVDVFNARPLGNPVRRSDGSIWNAEIAIGESSLMISQPDGGPPRPGFMYVYTEDVDQTFQKALDAGAREVMPPSDRFYGAYDGGVEDSQGNLWWIASHRRDMNESELTAAAREEEARRQK